MLYEYVHPLYDARFWPRLSGLRLKGAAGTTTWPPWVAPCSDCSRHHHLIWSGQASLGAS